MYLLPLVVAGLLALSALLAASETAVFSLVRMERLREGLSERVRNAVERLLREPLSSLVIVLGLNEAVNVFAECLASAFLLLWLGPAGAYVAVPLLLVVVLLFCDITPKTLALGFPDVIAAASARPLAALASVLHPLARLLGARPESAATAEALSETEFKALVRLGEYQGEVSPAEREFIHRVFEFANRRAANVMTPREKIFALDIAMPAEAVLTEVAHRHFSRVPMYRGSFDNIIGILHAKDLVERRLDRGAVHLERVLRPAHFVPPTKALGDLFEEMRRDRFQITLVVDEYGRIQGLVTLEDMLEELFGEIRDEFELEIPEVTTVSNDEWLVSGAIGLARFVETLGLKNGLADDRGSRTLSSYLLRRLGRVPRSGERLSIDAMELEVERVRGATIELVRVRRCRRP